LADLRKRILDHDDFLGAMTVDVVMAGGLTPLFSRFSLDLRGETRKRAHLCCLSNTGKTRAHR
jgi:hypothetical protein